MLKSHCSLRSSTNYSGAYTISGFVNVLYANENFYLIPKPPVPTMTQNLLIFLIVAAVLQMWVTLYLSVETEQ